MIHDMKKKKLAFGFTDEARFGPEPKEIYYLSTIVFPQSQQPCLTDSVYVCIA